MNATAFHGLDYDELAIGQRVRARFDGGEVKTGVISGPKSIGGAWPVQFAPCDAHWHCYEVSCCGDANGWTDREYRIAREQTEISVHARRIEAERRERYPDARFSMASEVTA